MPPRPEGELRSEDIRRRFTDPALLVDRLDLHESAQREGRNWKVLCPWHNERTPSCSIKLGPDGTVQVHCFACGGGGDALSLIAAVEGLELRGADFHKVLQRAADIVGVNTPVAPPRPQAPRTRLPNREILELWGRCLPPEPGDPELLGRALDPATLTDRALVRILPAGPLPGWASFRRRPWSLSGHRFVLPMYGATGDIESLHARTFGNAEPKALSPARGLLKGLVLADGAGVALLKGGKAPKGGCVIVEGVPDFLSMASIWSDGDEDAPAVIGVIAGSWSKELAARFPAECEVVVWTHTDASEARAGQKYAEVIARDLKARCKVRLVRQEVPDGRKKAPDVNDVLQDGGTAAVLEILRDADGTPDRARIMVSARIDLNRDAAVRALARSGAPIFHREGVLVDILPSSPPVIREVPRGHLTALLAGAVEWWRGDRLVAPPRDVVAAVAELGDWPGLRRLRAPVDHPVIRPDGSLLDRPGYDPATCLVFIPHGTFLPVPERPSQDEARAQVEWLLHEVVSQFPFEHPAGPSAWLASLLSILVRHAHDGPSPLFLIDGNLRGTGKTLLADTASLIATGKELAKLGPGKDEEETEKRLTAIGLSGASTVLFDNILRPLGNPALDKALTTTLYQGRLLGRSDASAVPRVPLLVTWWGTGNNVRVVGDMFRRIIRMRLLSPHERPEQVQNFRHADLRKWVLTNRPALLRASLTALRGWYAAGGPRYEIGVMGSFETWSEIVRQCICWLGLPDPLLCNDQGAADMDEEAQVLPDLLEGLEQFQKEVGEDWFSTAELVKRLTDRTSGHHTYPLPKLREALSELLGDRPIDARSIGYRLRRYNGRIANNRRLLPARDDKARGWRVERIRPASLTVPPEGIDRCPPSPLS